MEMIMPSEQEHQVAVISRDGIFYFSLHRLLDDYGYRVKRDMSYLAPTEISDAYDQPALIIWNMEAEPSPQQLRRIRKRNRIAPILVLSHRAEQPHGLVVPIFRRLRYLSARAGIDQFRSAVEQLIAERKNVRVRRKAIVGLVDHRSSISL